MQTQSNLSAILCLVAGIAIFSVQDLILKLLSGSYPLHEAMMLRSVTAIPCMLAITWWFDGSLRTLVSRSWPAMLARGILNFLAYTAYYLALAALPMATTVALYFTAPLIIVVLSVVMLHETVSLRRRLAVAMGFAGVLILVRPGANLFDWAALLPIFCGFAYALSMIMARTMGTKDSAAAMAFWGNNAFLLCSLALALVYLGSHAVQSNWSYFTMYRFKWTPKTVGMSLAVVGALVALVQGGLIRWITPKIGNEKSIYIGLLLYAGGMFLFAFASQSWMMFVFLIPYCLGGIAGPALQAIMCGHVPPNAQGELQGALTSVMSLTAIIGPLLMTNLFAYFTSLQAPLLFPGAPFLLGGLLMLSSSIVAYKSLKQN